MFTTFLDKASGLLDKQFLLGWWFPTLIAGAAGLWIGIWPHGLAAALAWWEAREGLAQTWLLLGALLAVTLVAYLLRAFTRPVIRFFEGYWPAGWRTEYLNWTKLADKWGAWRQERTAAAVAGDWARYAALQDKLHHEYPGRAERLLPTRLGNVLRAAEDYGNATYGMDAPFWWPRLAQVLPDGAQKSIQDALTPMAALLNLSTLFAFVTLAGALYLALNQRWWPFLLLLILGPLVCWLAYEGAVAQGRSYGQTIRSALDLYRLDLLRSLHQPLPADPASERTLWGNLAHWLYNQDRRAAGQVTYEHPPKK